MSASKKSSWVIVVAIIAALFFCAPLVINLINGENQTQKPSLQEIVEVKECDIEWAKGECGAKLLSGKLITDVEVDKIFVSVESVGQQELTYTMSKTETANASYCTYTLDAPGGYICNTVVDIWDEYYSDEGRYIVAHVYVQYDGYVQCVDTQTIWTESAWIGPY